MEEQILLKLKYYRHPVKTKNLSRSLGINEIDLTVILNKLSKEGKIVYMNKKNKDGIRFFGWCINPYQELHIGLFHTREELVHA